jgi:hypothetical protein
MMRVTSSTQNIGILNKNIIIVKSSNLFNKRTKVNISLKISNDGEISQVIINIVLLLSTAISIDVPNSISIKLRVIITLYKIISSGDLK